MQQWLQEGDGKRCLRHRKTFGTLEVCDECVSDPGPAGDEEAVEPVPPPAGCMSTADIEREFVADAVEMLRVRKKLVGKKVLDWHAYGAIAKIQDARTKALRAAHQLAERREDEAIVADRLRRLRELRGSH